MRFSYENMSILMECSSVLTNTTGKFIPPLKGCFELHHAHTFFVHDVFRWTSREQSGKSVIEGNQILGNLSSLRLICLQNRSVAVAFHDMCEFPPQIVS